MAQDARVPEAQVSFTVQYLKEVVHVCHMLPVAEVEALAVELAALRDRSGRLYIIGLGGSAGNASHMVNDMRKLCGIDASAPTDNVSELTARANDEGWSTIFYNEFWREGDAVFILSVGGGTLEVSTPIVCAIQVALVRKMRVLGIVGRESGYTKKFGHCVVVVPNVEPSRVTPHTEEFQAVVWHLLCSHPLLQKSKTKW